MNRLRNRNFALLYLFIIGTLLISAVFMGTLTSAFAQDGNYILDYQENFDDGYADGWILDFWGDGDSGYWQVEYQTLYSYGDAMALYDYGDWGDCVLRFRFMPDYIEYLLRAYVRFSEYSYAVELENISSYEFGISLGIYDPNYRSFSLIEQQTIDYNYYDEFIGEIYVRGGLIKVYIYPDTESNPAPLISYTDPDPLPPGTIGFEAIDYSEYEYYESYSTAWVDDVRVYIFQPTPTVYIPPTYTPTEYVPPSKTPTEYIPPTKTPTKYIRPTRTPTEYIRPTRTPTRYVPPTMTSTKFVPPPIEPPEPPYEFPVEILIIIGAIGAVGLGGAAGYLLVRWLRKPPAPPQQPPSPPEGPPDQPKQPPIIPIIPPLRLVKIWLSEGAGRGGRTLGGGESMLENREYSLHTQVQPGGTINSGSMPFGQGDQITPLTLVFFSPENDFEFDQSTAVLNLPERGASAEIRRMIKPKGTGIRRLRVCVYYGFTLLQSVLLEASVIKSGRQAARFGIKRVLDYVANPGLIGMERQPQPSVSIFTNQTSDGTHWIGVFSASDSGLSLSSGLMRTFGEQELKERALPLRELQATIQGGRNYRFTSPLPLDDQKIARIEKDLVTLALQGWRTFHNLFLAYGGDPQYDRLPTHLSPALISIARCRSDGPTIPWAALYDMRLDVGRADQIHLCGEFIAQLRSNQWSADFIQLIQKRDLLDDPRACAGRPNCPLKGPGRKITVCPFGFWGFVHQIEQPLQQVTPTSVDQVPPELANDETRGRYVQTSYIYHHPPDKLRIAVGAYPGIPNAASHIQEIQSSCPPDALEMVYSEDRDQVLQLLERDDINLYYFYCHGVIREQEFRLLLGPAGQTRYISAADLDPRETKWGDPMHPFIILNGCETMRLSPELIHGFLGVLRQMGASGVVGSEIPVNILLARVVGYGVVKRLLEGMSIGEAFLDIRRHLQRQGNPLGLAYSFYSPATLHLHDPVDCEWCRKNRFPGLAS